MNTLFLITLEYPPSIGGVGAYYHGLAQALGSDRITVLASDYRSQKDTDSSITVIRKKLLATRGPFRWWRCLWATARALRSHPSRYLGVGQLLPIGIVALLFYFFQHKRFIVFCHGMDILQACSHWRKKIIASWVMQKSSLIVVNSQSTLSLVREYFHIPSHRCIVVYPCADVEPVNTFRFEERPTILSVARLVARKGIDRVILALPQILLKVPSAQYVVVGDGPERSALTRLAQTTNFFDTDIGAFRSVLDAGRVRFLGALDRVSVLEWYQSCDVFALPVSASSDDIEGFGIVFLEAAAFEKPVVAGNSGGAVEAVLDQETGIVVGPENRGGLGDSISHLLLHPDERKRLGAQARARVMKDFRWEHQARMLIEALEGEE